MEELYILSKNKTRSWASDQELLIAKFRLKLKKVEKTTRPFRYDLNQIPYDYAVQVRNRFKGLDLIDSAWWTMDGGSWHCMGDRNQDHPQEKEMQNAKCLSEEALQIAVKRREAKRKRRGIFSLVTALRAQEVVLIHISLQGRVMILPNARSLLHYSFISRARQLSLIEPLRYVYWRFSHASVFQDDIFFPPINYILWLH